MVSHPVQSTSSSSATPDINPPISLHSKILPPTQMWYILTVPQISSFSAWPSPSSAQPHSVSPFGRLAHIFFLLLLFFSLLSIHCILHWKILPSPLTTRSTQLISCIMSSSRALYKYNPTLRKNKTACLWQYVIWKQRRDKCIVLNKEPDFLLICRTDSYCRTGSAVGNNVSVL